jgi:serine beta-lactamase-like protein LACTB, mitochondrial
MKSDADTNSARRKMLTAIFILLSGYPGGAMSPSAHAQTAAPTSMAAAPHYAGAEEHARAVAKEWLQRGIPGVSLAVAVDGKIVYSEGFGFADLEQRVPAWPTTKFRIASVSKPLTAAALMQLVEQGKIDLDAPIQKYVPSLPDKGALITTRMLAGHLAGIRHYRGDEFLISKHYQTVLEGLRIFADDPLVSAPGKEFHYSSYGFNLVSAVIESTSQESFLSYMHNHVFAPLGLRNTLPDQPSEIIAERARFYRKAKDQSVQNAPFVDNSYKWAGGGFLSTAEDLVQFGSALLQPGFLKPESLRLLFTSQKTADGKETGYGMGWFVGKSSSGQRIYAHDGGAAGGSSRLVLYPDTHVVVAMICNFEGQDGWKGEEVESIAEGFERTTNPR